MTLSYMRSAAEAEVYAKPWRCIEIRPRRCLRRRGRIAYRAKSSR
jgi:hypothetical protein